MIPASYNFQVMRGTQGPTQGLVFRLRTLVSEGVYENIAYDDIRLSIYDKRGTTLLLRPTISENSIIVVDAPTNTFAWNPTAEETRLIPKGELKAYYELEVWYNDTQIVYMLGYITGLGGSNDDEAVS